MNRKARKRLVEQLRQKKDADQAQVITALIPREDVETMNVGRTLSAIQVARMNTLTARRFRDRVYLGIGGFTESDGELHRHESVRRYLRELDRQFPYLFWFSNASADPEAGNTFLLLLMRATCPSTAAVGGRDFISNDDVRIFMRRHLASLDELGGRLNLARAEIESRVREVLAFYRAFVPNIDRVLGPAEVRPRDAA